MEKTGGEPNLLEFDSDTKEYFFVIFQRKVLQKEGVFVMKEKL